MRLFIAITALVLLVSTEYSNSQSLDCTALTSTGCGDWNGPYTQNVPLGFPDCNVDVTYKKRTCSTAVGVFTEYFITGTQVIDGCDGVWDPNRKLFHLESDAFKEYLNLGFLQTVTDGVPHCSTGTAPRFATVYTAACGLWVSCTYNLAEPVVYDCPAYWSGPLPHYGSNPAKVKVSQWQSCGETCCRRVYSLCRETRHPNDGLGHVTSYIKMTLISKERLGDCTQQSTYTPQPCLDGC
jgi:hypothetical protein